MNRRKFFRLSALGAMTIALPRFVFSQYQQRPNVLFIAIDDLNGWVGCLRGHPDVKTPNLDRLAERGILFTNAHCPSPICNPSRTSIFTGIRPSTSGVYTNYQSFRVILPNAVTIPQHFMAHSYRVVGGGKIFHPTHPDVSSWHEYFPSKVKTRPNDPRPTNRPAHGIPGLGSLDWAPLDIPDNKMSDWKVTDWAIKELDKKRDKPFFLAVGIVKPHLPWYVPSKYFEMYPPDEIALPIVKENDLDDVPPLGRGLVNSKHNIIMEHNQWRNAVSAYLASISFADAMVGRVIDALDQSAYSQNTVIVLFSDNGFHLGEKSHWHKFTLWEESTHCILMFAAPGITESGGRCSESVSLLDIYPTLIDVCHLSTRSELEEESLLPLLENPQAVRVRPALTTTSRNNHSLRFKRWRYTRYSDSTEELYDHEKDPLEWTNLADNPEYTFTNDIKGY